MTTIDREKIDYLIADRFIGKQRHPTFPLTILNYTPRTQYEKYWTPETLMCRGLVVEDETDRIVARPFPKFFNLSEKPEGWTPAEGPVDVAKKYDGSLLITFRYDGQTIHATRRSFTTRQAIRGGQIFHRQNGRLTEHAEGWTYLHEVIYPENRVVVNYGAFEGIIPLAKINTDTGEEEHRNYFRLAQYRSVEAFHQALPDLMAGIGPNDEGYVIRFADGERVKIKGDEYLRLHRILTGLNERVIWEYLVNGAQTMDEFLAIVPDEFYQWVQDVKGRLERQVEDIARAALWDYETIRSEETIANPAEFARQAKETQYPNLLFAIRNGKDYRKMIWKLVKPGAVKPPFLVEADEE